MQRDYLKLYKSLNRNRVKYLIIGGIACIIYGVPRTTLDIDIFIEVSLKNAERLLKALKEINFGTALITFEQWEKLSDSSLIIRDDDKTLRVDIIVTGAEFEIRPETIKEDLSGRRLPTRLGINLSRPVTRALVSLTIAPAEAPGAAASNR